MKFIRQLVIIIFCATGALFFYYRKMGPQPQNFTLLTSLYNEKNLERAEEYKKCLEINLAHPLIQKIHILYDTNNDDPDKPGMLEYLTTKNVVISKITGRPTYQFCFDIANTLYTDQKIIISNADIYFNETLGELENFDLSGKFLALTRWNVASDGTLKLYKGNWSQDAWIFKIPLPPFADANIQLGTAHCDGKILYEAKKANLQVQNPCLSVQCCHLHLISIHNYSRDIETPMHIMATAQKSLLY